MGRSRSLTVYDPNQVNPYGRELAALLAREHDVRYVGSRRLSWRPAGARTEAVLAHDRHVDGLVRTVALRAIGPLRVAARAVLRREVVVVAWTRDAWDSAVLTLASLLGAELLVINHNPTAIRPRPGAAGRADRVLKARTTNVVHSASLVEAATADARHVVVAPHPPYTQWAAAFAARRPKRAEREGTTLLALGTVRPDKGLDAFADVASAAATRPLRVVVAGMGSVPARVAATLTRHGVELDDRTAPLALSDEEVGAAIVDSDVMLAPYRSATQSGAVVLALSAGLPVLGYDDGALPDVLAPRALTDGGDPAALAANVDAFVADPFPTFVVDADTLADACAVAWARVLDDRSRS